MAGWLKAHPEIHAYKVGGIDGNGVFAELLIPEGVFADASSREQSIEQIYEHSVEVYRPYTLSALMAQANYYDSRLGAGNAMTARSCEQALAWFSRVGDLMYYSSRMRWMKGLFLQRLGRFEEAAREYGAASNLEYGAARAAYFDSFCGAFVSQAQALASSGDWARAREVSSLSQRSEMPDLHVLPQDCVIRDEVHGLSACHARGASAWTADKLLQSHGNKGHRLERTHPSCPGNLERESFALYPGGNPKREDAATHEGGRPRRRRGHPPRVRDRGLGEGPSRRGRKGK